MKKEIADEQQKTSARLRAAGDLPMPSPDQFAFRMTHYRGLVRHPERLRNYIVSQHDEFDETRQSLPTRLDIEPISRCNFRCVMCQVSDWEGGKRADNMKIEDFRAFVDSQYGLCEVKLQGFGEPLMHKDYVSMVEYLVAKDIWVRTTVNGSLLHVKDNYKRLMDSGVGDVNISVDGADKEVFESIRRRSDFNLVASNLKLLNDYVESIGKTNTMMWVVLQKANRHQVFDFVELAKKVNFKRLTFSVGLSDWGQEKWMESNNKIQVHSLTREEIDRLQSISDTSDLKISVWDLKSKYSVGDKKNLCHWPFKWGFVGSDLRVAPCCMIGNPDVIETGHGSDFTADWNGERYREFRRAHLSGQIPKICQNCYAKPSH